MATFAEQDRRQVKAALTSLLDEDIDLLLERGAASKYADGDIILEEGSQRRLLLVLLEGRAVVVRTYLGTPITIATVGPGEIVGEVSFFDGRGASASIIADGMARVVTFDPAAVQSLLYSVPGLAARLFQSLGGVLASRLRATSEMIPPMIVEDIPQVRRFHAERSTGETSLPPSLVTAVEDYKRSMLEAQLALKDRKAETVKIGQHVHRACSTMNDALRDHVVREARLTDAIGTHVFRETFPFMMASRFLGRCYMKPRGYAGDFETIDIIYNDEPAGDGALGKHVDRWALDLNACKAVRSRRHKIAGDVLARVKGAGRSVRVTSLASGPAREMFDILAQVDPTSVHFVGIDIDDLALESVARTARDQKVVDAISLYRDNIVKLARGRGATKVEPQDIIYSLGLIDYLQDAEVVRLIDWCFNNLAPGGQVALGNFATTSRDKPFMDHVGEWLLTHRTPDQLREFFSRSKFGKAPVRVDHDPTGIQLFAYCQKP